MRVAPGVIDTPMWDKVDALFAKYEDLDIWRKEKERLENLSH